VDISRRKFILSTALLIPMMGMGKAYLGFKENHFRHGLASGDPLQDRVVIWTRISSLNYSGKKVKWQVATDPGFIKIIKSGEQGISALSDYTVKVDVHGLMAGMKYYYRFIYQKSVSPVGRTQTLPKALNGRDFNIAVVSCNNWEDGFFNSFRFLAQKKEVDLVLHLGDYIYEYATGEYGNPGSGRINEPKNELLTLHDYRTRHAQYRTDANLQVLHLNKPFYVVWDDHDLANDAYADGAKNHQPNEGLWQQRKADAIQAYLEWMPIRAKNATDICRKFEIGDDISLYLMDERSLARTKQMDDNEVGFESQDRAIIGNRQYNWLANELKKSKSTWKLIANQVMFSGYAVAKGFKLPKYNDWWLGYPYERNKIIKLLTEENIGNPIFLTGDHHESFVLALHKEEKFMQYTKTYHEKPLAWEFLTPSITSRNGDRKGKEEIVTFENMLADANINPHMVFGDIKSHGYFIASINKHTFKSDYFFVDNILTPDAKEHKAAVFSIDAKTFKLSKQ
jgi:alkaline phosphatase D